MLIFWSDALETTVRWLPTSWASTGIFSGVWFDEQQSGLSGSLCGEAPWGGNLIDVMELGASQTAVAEF